MLENAEEQIQEIHNELNDSWNNMSAEKQNWVHQAVVKLYDFVVERNFD